jgi:hypothetical protein
MKFFLNNIEVPPKWVIEPKDIQLNSENDLSIECRAEGEPKPRISWINAEGIALRLSLISALVSIEYFLN